MQRTKLVLPALLHGKTDGLHAFRPRKRQTGRKAGTQSQGLSGIGPESSLAAVGMVAAETLRPVARERIGFKRGKGIRHVLGSQGACRPAPTDVVDAASQQPDQCGSGVSCLGPGSALAAQHTEREDRMRLFTERVRRFLVSEDGPTAIEYAVMLALIIIVCLATISTLGTNANKAFSTISASLGTVTGS